jgi:diguanylate cyclase (GGDEF)-like protein/PAS domain S-box-containing protein
VGEAARANALDTIGHLMLRMPLRAITYSAVAGIASAVAGIAWLFGAAIAEGRALSTVEHVTLDLLIGAVILLSLGWLVLRRQWRGQTQYQQEIDAAKRTLDTAIGHMSQGLVMFDASQRIVLCNRRYIEMYGVSPAIVKPGLPFRDLLIHRKESGSFLADVDEYCAMVTNMAQGKTSSLVAESSGGRLIQILNEPLEGGGWVATHEDVTEWRRAEERVREQKLQLDTALNTMSQGLNMFDASGRLVLCNERYLRMYGLSPEIAKPGCTVKDLVDARIASGTFFSDDPQRYTAELLDAMRLRKGAQTTMKLPDGRTIAVSSQPTPDENGWVVTHEDITERQLLVEAQELSEKIASKQKMQLDAALNNMIHGLCMFDDEGRIVFFNRRYGELMGESAEFLQGRSLLDVCRHRKTIGTFQGDPDEFFARTVNTAREGEIAVKEFVRADGIALRVINKPMDGGGWVATFEDITEQRLTERDRDRNRAFLDLIIDHVPSAILVKTATDRKYVLVNRAVEQFWNVSREAMIGHTAREVFSEQEAQTIELRENELLKSGKPLFDERDIRAPNGGVRSVLSRRLPVRDENDAAEYILVVLDDVTDRKAAEAKIAQLAHYDPLTNLPNRTLFREQLERELSFVKRGAQLAVLYLDLDHFKSINDTLGHPCGDALLKVVAQRLRSCLRESDLIARLGGDEFAIVQTQLQHPNDAAILAQRLREAITGTAYDLNGHQTTTDLSIGIALSPEDGTEMDELVKHADLALYGAKAEGRANYRYFEPDMNARMKQRRGLEVDLRSALAKEEFELHYQPLVNLQTQVITGCEVLLRWNHPERGRVPPIEFIPIAEENGLINAIGEWVLRSACVEAMNWPDHARVAVNVSPVQFRNPGLALSVVNALAASGLPAHRLELEVTESVLMQNNDATLAMLHQIRNLGVRISMDDFGTGYSSLSYLRSFPFDKIKIDQSFIRDLSKGDEAVAIVHAILNLASSLKMTTTAEGVETAEQQRLLQATGCNEMQGYLFSPPRPAAEIAALFTVGAQPLKVVA